MKMFSCFLTEAASFDFGLVRHHEWEKAIEYKMDREDYPEFKKFLDKLSAFISFGTMNNKSTPSHLEYERNGRKDKYFVTAYDGPFGFTVFISKKVDKLMLDAFEKPTTFENRQGYHE